jgi:hypothetical protein
MPRLLLNPTTARMIATLSSLVDKSQIWIAVAVYVLVAIVKKRLALPARLYEILQILSLTLFEKTPVNGLFDDDPSRKIPAADANQLNLFN